MHLHFWQRLRRFLAVLALFVAGFGATGAWAEEIVTDSKSQAVARTVMGIMAYTRWPTEQEVIQLCIVGPTEYADELLKGGLLPSARVAQVRRMRLDDAALLTQCQGLYAGRLDDRSWNILSQRLQGLALLTISERQELCQLECMFCLDVRGTSIGFDTNLDAVARSGVRINPRVLQLSRRKGSGG